MKSYPKILSAIAFFLTVLTTFLGKGQSLEQGFKNPPKEAKPRTWMHVMSGNMSKVGLTKDLEAMAEAGIGGLLLFNITQGIPNGDIVYNSPEHHALLTHAAQESERLGLSFGVHNCDGWSSSGGPWVKPEESMKMVVWSEQIVQGGSRKTVKLAQPTTREGFYREIAVLAYPSLKSEIIDSKAKPKISSSDKTADVSLLNNGRWDAQTTLKKIGDTNPWIQFDYEKPTTIRSAYVIHNERNTNFSLEISDDGQHFRKAIELKKVRTGKGEWANNVHFEPITSKYFRLVGDATFTIKEANLTATYLLDNQLGRTAIARTEADQFDPIGLPTKDMVIDKKAIIDLSSKLQSNGDLTTDLPSGNWTILRFGYTSTSASNNPASVEGKGLEVDKLNRAAFKKHYDAFVKKVIDNSKPVAPNALQYIEIDSYEMGGQNWTDGFDKLFFKEFGYEIRTFLPLVAGKFVESAKSSEAVLDDYRTIVCDLFAKNYFAYFQELCHADGLQTYIEPYGFGPLNDLDAGKYADLPMGEFWMNRPITQVASAISAAHIYGKPVISAESFTAEQQINWKGHPAIAKSSGDKAWALGINEFMFHRFAHQANTNVEPGMTMNRWGSHFDRTQTWWLNAGKAWFEYIARGSYLLRQGVPVSDLLVFVGDASPNSTFARDDFKPAIPMGTNFDCVNADVLINRITVKNGKLVLPEGTSYEALVLKNLDKIKLKTLQRLHEFAKLGILIIGPKPTQLLGYAATETDKKSFESLVTEIWKQPNTHDKYDWEKIFAKYNIQPDLNIEGRTDINFMHRKTIEGDTYFLYNPDADTQTLKTTFRIADRLPELWNPMTGETKTLAAFTQKNGATTVAIELTAEESMFVVFRKLTQDIAYVIPENTTLENIKFEISKHKKIVASISENGTYETKISNGSTWMDKIKEIPEPFEINGKWNVKFPQKLGFGGSFVFDELTDWKNHPNDGIQHYSGTATYQKTFILSQNFKESGNQIMLDLGDVSIAAEVKLNGKPLGILWIAPFVIDVTDAIVKGENILEIAVTNQWSNKLIGDERYPANDDNYQFGSQPENKMPRWYVNNQPRPAGQRTTFTTANFYKATDELLPSGLNGPVKLSVIKQVIVK